MFKETLYAAMLVFILLTKSFADIIDVPGDYPKVQEAIDISLAGDTIWVASGEYLGDSVVVSKPLVLMGNGKDSTTIISMRPLSIRSDGVTIKNLEIQGAQTTGGAATPGMIIDNSSNILIENSIVFVYPSTDISGLGVGGRYGILIYRSSNITIDSTQVNGGDGSCVNPCPGGSGGNAIDVISSSDIIIKNCTIKGGNGGDIAPGGYGVNAIDSSSATISFSTMAGGTGNPNGSPFFYDSTSTMDTTSVLIVSVNEERAILPSSMTLYQNYPNPFNPTTLIRYGLPKASNVMIEVYNILGERVLAIEEQNKNAGYHLVEIDGSNLASGMYIYKITADRFVDMKKMLLVR